MRRLFETVPWLEPALSWLIALMAIWLLASLPAAMLQRATASIPESIRRWAGAMLAAVKRARMTRLEEIARAKAKLFEDSGERPLDRAVHEQWLDDASAFRQPLLDATRAFSSARDQNDRAIEAVSSVQELLRTADTSQLPPIPPAGAIADAERSRITSLLNLFLSTGLLVPILLVNAQLTALVLRAVLGNMQGVFAGIPPAYALAIVVTLAEAAIGVAHGVFSAAAATKGRQYTLSVLGMVLLGLVAVFVEFLFFSQFADVDGQPLALPLLGVSVPPGTAFSLLGLLLGSSVVILGGVVYASWRAVLQPGSLKRTRKRYESLRKTLGDLQAGIQARKTAVGDLLHLTSDLHAQLRERKLSLATDEFVARASSFLAVTPDWVRPVRRPLTASEVAAIESDSILPSIVAIVGGAAMVFLSTVGMLGAVPSVHTAVASAVALIPTAAMFYAGFMFGQRMRQRASGPFPGIGALLLGAGVSLGAGYLIGTLSGWTIQLMLVGGVIISGGLLFSSGASLAGRMGLVLLKAQAAFVQIGYAFLFVLCGLCFPFWWLAAVVDGTLAVVAYPVTWLTHSLVRRRLAQ